MLSISESGVGGYKDASAEVTGKGAFAKMKFESGVHRVQRVPTTETQEVAHPYLGGNGCGFAGGGRSGYQN